MAGLGAGVLVGAACYWLPATALVSETARRVFGVHATTPGQGVALTFDDGPHREGTPRVLDILAQEQVQATFFLAGEQVDGRPVLAAEILHAGHTVGVHCYRHRNLMRLTPGQVREDLRRAADAIESAVASVPELYRPPYGILTTPALAHAKRQTWQSVLWRKDGHDWKERATPQSISARILDGLRPGDIVLLHDSDAYSAADSWRPTVRALPRVIDAIRHRGLAFVPLA